jgi:hypothetical protein
MITNMQTNYDFTTKYVGVVTEDVEKDYARMVGATLYVPETMCNSYNPGGMPETSKIQTNGTSIFLNDKACKPKIANKVTVKNWMTGKLENNEIYSPGEYFPRGSKVEVSYVHGKVSVPQFNSNFHFE